MIWDRLYSELLHGLGSAFSGFLRGLGLAFLRFLHGLGLTILGVLDFDAVHLIGTHGSCLTR